MAKENNEENTAKAMGRGMPISTKQSIEICNFIRNKPLAKAKTLLNEVLDMKKAVPFKRFASVGHKKGKLASGRYPLKATKAILELLESAEANARNQGLSVPDLFVAHIAPNRGRNNWKPGRQGRRKSKSTHIEIILKEGVATKGVKKEAPKKAKKVVKKEAPKAEAPKKEEPKVEEKKEEPKVEEKPAEEPKEEKVEEKKEEAAPAETSQ